jgi:hypothetical protein
VTDSSAGREQTDVATLIDELSEDMAEVEREVVTFSRRLYQQDFPTYGHQTKNSA